MTDENMAVSNEDLICQLRDGDNSALEQLCRNNMGLIKKKAWRLSWDYGANHVDEQGWMTEYTRTLLEDLESVGMIAFIACVTRGRYDPDAARLVTYVYRFIDGAMRRYMETNLHAISFDRDTMTLARKAQALCHKYDYNAEELAVILDISAAHAAECLNICLYPDRSLDDGDGEERLREFLPGAPLSPAAADGLPPAAPRISARAVQHPDRKAAGCAGQELRLVRL